MKLFGELIRQRLHKARDHNHKSVPKSEGDILCFCPVPDADNYKSYK